MSVTELLLSGVDLMLLGMGIVFLFLAILVLAMNSMSWLAQKIEVAEPAVEFISSTTTSAKRDSGNDELIAVVTAAIKRYRAK